MQFPDTLIEKAAGRKDVRFYLNNPFLDTENKRLIASNGHIAAIVPVEVSDEDVDGPVSEDALKAARKASKEFPTSNDPEIICNGLLEVTNGPSFPRPDCDFTYPDIDRVIPDADNCIQVSFNAELLFNLAKAIGSGYYKYGVCLHINPDNLLGAIRVTNSSDRYGALMPMRV